MADIPDTNADESPAPQADAANEEISMEFHKPKPVHNWREFLSEIGVVVIGVCIALAAEQVMEWVHWRNQVTKARQVIATEMSYDVSLATHRMRSAQCVERRLDVLAAILDGATQTGTLPPVGDIGMTALGYWASGSWESVVASQTATHFPPEQLASLTTTYRLVTGLADYQSQEIGDWNSLYSMVGPGRRLDPASDARLRDALSNARAVNRVMVLNSFFLVQDAKASGLPFSAADLKTISESETDPMVNPNATVCALLGAVPSAYGQAMWNSTPTLVRAEKASSYFAPSKQ